MHTYDHHIGDYTRDTVGLDFVEDAAYRRLLDQYYLRELPLPSDRRECYRLARAATAAQRKAVDYVLGRYFDLTPDGYRQKRADEVIETYHEKSAGAKAAANLRWQRERARSKTQSNENAGKLASERTTPAMQPHSESNAQGHANAMPSTSHLPLPLTTKTKAAAPPGVDQDTWDSWVRQKGKKQTAAADAIQRKRLSEWKANGHDVQRIVEDAIAGHWQGLHPPKVYRLPPATARDKRAEKWDAITQARATSAEERVIDGTAERLDWPSVHPLRGDLREPGADDVGERGPERSAAGLG